jgi:CTP-dependent riboflavin kinase
MIQFFILNQLNYLDQIVNPAFWQIEGIENNQQANVTNILFKIIMETTDCFILSPESTSYCQSFS